ncbi:hypothetical protein [Rhodopirellula sp. SWK7]|uniref:hypothetical protein n=1 Tax=Rhodopirellula sp. SWK7 TaxID=595460 RepID=UPI0002BD76B2|nr:hypothetical protein [Rhodopirellula sp. SWK7]EMI44054.1 signal peptide protein [Rhodopirellula sp. SWK7]
MQPNRHPLLSLLLITATTSLSIINHVNADDSWIVDSQSDWQEITDTQSGLSIDNGVAAPTGESAVFRSKMKTFASKRTAQSITIDQSPIWQNWNPVKNIGPSNLGDAPVVLSLGPNDYWMFGRYIAPNRKAKASQRKTATKNATNSNDSQPSFQPEPATLDGFDIPLLTTNLPNQFNAPGGVNNHGGGYHAWQSKDMVNWVHHGMVTEDFSRWVTTAEFVDGKFYIYYDYPNDQDPHLYIDEDLTDGKPGKNMGMAFKDPSDGSDCNFIRDLDGNFHVIYEDWSPIDANKRSWDSPLAGHAMSRDGIKDFEILAPVVDNRTTPTGKTATYKHPHWLQHPDFKTNVATYDVHEPEQEAYGDWASVCIGGRYYLFGDYDPVGGHSMSVGWFTSPTIDGPFEWCDNVGKGHPDPDVCFAEGQFYLITQQKTDYTSPGPWVDGVQTRVGVDTDNDGVADVWTDWATVKESYDYTPGFAKQVQKTPASLDLSSLPAGHGFQFEIKLNDTTENKSKPMLDKVTLSFD